MRVKYSEAEVKKICQDFFTEIQENHFQVKMTMGGSPCIIMSRSAGGDKPIMGVYYTGEEWLPVKWTKNGNYINHKHSRPLDVDMNLESEDAA